MKNGQSTRLQVKVKYILCHFENNRKLLFITLYKNRFILFHNIN